MAINYDHALNTHDQESAVALAKYIDGFLDGSKKIVDWGCGTGLLGKALEQLGHKVTYIDGIQAITEARVMDFTQECDVEYHDVAICLEVAEHLEEKYAETFVRNVCNSSDMVFFSGAIPFQIGQNHVNCQWPDYWQNIFAKYGYGATDIRQCIWDNRFIEVWYRQNLIMYEYTDEVKSPRLMALIHPDFYDTILNYATYLSEWLKTITQQSDPQSPSSRKQA